MDDEKESLVASDPDNGDAPQGIMMDSKGNPISWGVKDASSGSTLLGDDVGDDKAGFFDIFVGDEAAVDQDGDTDGADLVV